METENLLDVAWSHICLDTIVLKQRHLTKTLLENNTRQRVWHFAPATNLVKTSRNVATGRRLILLESVKVAAALGHL